MLTISLKNGENITAGGSIENLEEFVAQINNQAINAITIGNVPINKAAISYISSSHLDGESSNITIYLMNGTKVESYDEAFNATEYSAKINNQQNLFTLLGDVIINKFDYMMALERAT